MGHGPATQRRRLQRYSRYNMGKLLKGYRMTTAEVLYRTPDYPSLLQSFIRQTLDLPPKYPVLVKFLDHWEQNLDGSIHSGRVARRKLVKPATMRGWTRSGASIDRLVEGYRR